MSLCAIGMGTVQAGETETLETLAWAHPVSAHTPGTSQRPVTPNMPGCCAVVSANPHLLQLLALVVQAPLSAALDAWVMHAGGRRGFGLGGGGHPPGGGAHLRPCCSAGRQDRGSCGQLEGSPRGHHCTGLPSSPPPPHSFSGQLSPFPPFPLPPSPTPAPVFPPVGS